LLNTESFDLHALVEDHVLGVGVKVQPEIYDVSTAHKGIELLLDAVEVSIWTDRFIRCQGLYCLTHRTKVVIVEYIHLVIGQADSQVGQVGISAAKSSIGGLLASLGNGGGHVEDDVDGFC